MGRKKSSKPSPAVTSRGRLAKEEESVSEEIIREYWNSLSDEGKRKWLRVEVSKVKKHVDSELGRLRKFLKDALAWWTTSDGSWLCFRCLEDEFGNTWNQSEVRKHVLHFHLEISKNFKNLPRRMDRATAGMMLKSSWEPLSEGASKVPDDGSEGGGCSAHVFDEARLSPAHPERSQLLQDIRSSFAELWRRGCLGETHITMFWEMVKTLRPLPGNILAGDGLQNFPSFFGYLEAPLLSIVLLALRRIVDSCGQDGNVDNMDTFFKKTSDLLKTVKKEDRMILDNEASCFVLTEGLLLDFSSKIRLDNWKPMMDRKGKEADEILAKLKAQISPLRILVGERSELLNRGIKSPMLKAREMGIVDAKILGQLARMEKLADEFTALRAVDYHELLVPLVSLIVQENLKDPAMNYAKEKAQAAEETLVPGEGQRVPKKIRKKKNKKKKKKSRNVDDVKATGSGAGDAVHNETDQPDSSSLAQVEGETRLMSPELGDVLDIPAVDQSINLMEGKNTDNLKEFLTVKISDFKDFFRSSNVDSIGQFITDSLEFVETHGSWSFYFCCICQEKFRHLESYEQHIMTEHLGYHLKEMQAGMPKFITEGVEDEKNVAPPSEGASCWLQHEKDSAGQEKVNVRFKEDASDAAFLSWIFTESSSAREELKKMKDKICQAEQVLSMLQELHKDLRLLCDQRRELLNAEPELKAVEHLVLEEAWGQSSLNRSNNIVLRKTLREFKKMDVSMDWICKMDATCSVFEGAETRDADLNDKMVKIEARIQSQVSMVQQKEDELQRLSLHDYQSTLLSLVKSFLRARLERLSENASGVTFSKEQKQKKQKKQKKQRAEEAKKT